MLDCVILGATEVDVNFNVNVNTESSGYLLHNTGGPLRRWRQARNWPSSWRRLSAAGFRLSAMP